jgi:hypothetical protein
MMVTLAGTGSSDSEPRTPSPMRDLMGIVASPPPEAVVPSDQLFSRYLSPVTSPEGTYSDESEEPVPASVTIISPLSVDQLVFPNTVCICSWLAVVAPPTLDPLSWMCPPDVSPKLIFSWKPLPTI